MKTLNFRRIEKEDSPCFVNFNELYTIGLNSHNDDIQHNTTFMTFSHKVKVVVSFIFNNQLQGDLALLQ